MGWCHEFGPDINAGCDHPMVADTTSCRCTACGVVCTGKFAGCAAVWAAGPRTVRAVRAPHARPAPVAEAVPVAETAPVPEAAPQVAPADVAANGAAVEALRTDLASVVRRLDEMQVEALRTDLTWVVQRLDELTVALRDQEQQFERLAASPPRPRIADQGPVRPPDLAQPAPPTAAEPEHIDLAVPLDQALVRPIRPGSAEPERR